MTFAILGYLYFTKLSGNRFIVTIFETMNEK